MNKNIYYTEEQQKYLDRFSFIPDERKIQYNRSLTSIQLLYYYSEFKNLLNPAAQSHLYYMILNY